ncbi:cytosol aminopeptidase signature [Lucifera butyrica]|uniref:Probable cytosol aminopeptidase n=1 Tax=Lucifera butyrica TaxID=1351585 RepID=A0A498R758_9FIRM|nr:leucyl aminopeptidase [Lucifera butyrica]VBB06003.1 cytosol aminopeptidase signature [Lucifera butyrica]
MEIEVVCGSAAKLVCDALILTLFEQKTEPEFWTKQVGPEMAAYIQTIIQDQPQCSKLNEITVLPTGNKLGAKQIILAGAGEEKRFTMDRLRSVCGTAVQTAQKLNATSISFLTAHPALEKYAPATTAQTIVEGIILGSYQFNQYKTETDSSPAVKKIILISHDTDRIAALEQGCKTGKIIAENVNGARDLVNHPSSYMTPSRMAEYAAAIAKQEGVLLTVLDKAEMIKQKMHALLAVAQGSQEPPQMIILQYWGDRQSKEIAALVGKGITFDSGGISLKPSEGMQEMKDDMAGGAAVMYAMAAIARLKLKINIMAIIPCTENMPSGTAFKPGDVITSMAGKTIEIISTDAEGRLILADAITYARKLGATQLIDVATLTGACVIALGTIVSGIITNNKGWCKKLMQAAAAAGEKMWQLPNYEEYKEQIKSSIADMKNSGGRPAGAITAGIFISQFVDNLPWVHIDIAGTVTSDKNQGYQVKGATGVAVRTLVQLARDMSAS